MPYPPWFASFLSGHHQRKDFRGQEGVGMVRCSCLVELFTVVDCPGITVIWCLSRRPCQFLSTFLSTLPAVSLPPAPNTLLMNWMVLVTASLILRKGRILHVPEELAHFEALQTLAAMSSPTRSSSILQHQEAAQGQWTHQTLSMSWTLDSSCFTPFGRLLCLPLPGQTTWRVISLSFDELVKQTAQIPVC